MTFYDERKWCTRCRASVPFLSSIGHTYCTECGLEVVSFYSPAERRSLAALRAEVARGDVLSSASPRRSRRHRDLQG